MSDKSIYDNSNLAESYAGVTTPLTFSFAKYVYKEVYKHFSRMMGVSEQEIESNEEMFGNMVVFIGYNMYYDLLNWYKMVSFLPGWKLNRSFFEKMLGVEKEYEYKVSNGSTFWKKYFLYLPRLFFQTLKILFYFIFMGKLISRFNNHFDQVYDEFKKESLSSLSADDLKEVYKKLDRKLLKKWRVPIANDFAVMVSTGLSEKLSKKWLDRDDIYTFLRTSPRKPLSSLDPGLELVELADEISQDSELIEIFKNEDPDQILKKMHNQYSDKEAVEKFNSYLEKFGNRFPNELKLESKSLKEKPQKLIRLLTQSVCNSTDQSFSREDKCNEKDNFNVDTGSRIKDFLMGFLLQWARSSIRRREITRFRRTLVFGAVREIFIEIGKRFKNKDTISDIDDIFYLEVDEIFKLIEDNVDFNPESLIKERKKEYKRWSTIKLPRRIETNNNIGELEKKLYQDYNNPKNEQVNKPVVLKGEVAAKKKKDQVEGESLVLTKFDSTASFEEKILVTKQTDPGWTIIFPALKGIIVERGGMLSHAAIMARELDIPCIIGVNDATDLIKSDKLVKMKLTKGEIYVE